MSDPTTTGAPFGPGLPPPERPRNHALLRSLADVGAALLVALLAATLLFAVEVPTAPYTHEGQAYVEGATRLAHLFAGGAEGAKKGDAMQAWAVHSHHAPVVKLAMAASYATLHGSQGAYGSISVGLVLLTLLTLLLTIRMAWAAGGPAAGLASGLFLAGMPRFSAYAATVSAEAVIAFAWVLLAWTFARALESRVYVIPALLAFGIAMGADSQGIWMAVPLLIATHFILSRPSNGGVLHMAPFPPQVLVILGGGAVAFLASWPLLRHEAGKQLVAYLLDPLSKEGRPVLHAGVRWDPATGLDAPFGETLLQLVGRLPVVAVLAALLGLAVLLHAVVRRRRGLPASSGHRATLLLVPTMIAATGILICALNGSPFYHKGIDRLVPLSPLVAMLAGLGIATLAKRLAALLPAVRRRLAAGAVWATILLAVAPGWVQAARAGGDAVVYYGAGAGCESGAVASGEQLMADPLITRALLDWLNAHADRGAVAFVPFDAMLSRVVRRLKQDGRLNPELELGSPETAEWVIVPLAPESDEFPLAMMAFRQQDPADIIQSGGVPLYTVFRGTPAK